MSDYSVNSKRLAWHKLGERHASDGRDPMRTGFPNPRARDAYERGYRIRKRDKVREAANR